MKINKFIFLISCIFLVGCSNGVSKNQKNDYQNTLKSKYPEYNYLYINKNNQYEIEFTKDYKKILLDDDDLGKDTDFFLKYYDGIITDVQENYRTLSLDKVFDKGGEENEKILDTIIKNTDKRKIDFSPVDYISGDFFSIVTNNLDNNMGLDVPFFNYKLFVPSSITLSPNENKIIKVLTDKPFIIHSETFILLVQNTDKGIYALNIDDQPIFNLLEKIYSSKKSQQEKNNLFSSLLAANEEISIAIDVFGIDVFAGAGKRPTISIEEMNQRFTTLNNFIYKHGIKNKVAINDFQNYIYNYKEYGNEDNFVLALKSASDNRTNLINNILSSSGSTDNKEKQIETKLPTATYPDKTYESIYRLDGIESKYTYDSSLVKNAIKKVKKMSEMTIKNNYIVKENEIGQLYINVYSPNKQDEIIENYVFDPYTKNIAASEDFDNSSEDSVQVIISEAIEAIEKQTSYSTNNQMPYIMSGYVTDDGFIAIDISISDENNPGGVIKQDQAIYDPNTHSISEFSQNSPVEDNDGSNEEELIEEAINKIEQSTGYIQDNPYVYDAYIEEGTVIVEVRAAGAGDSGTMSIIDRFQYVPQNEQIYVYDSVSGRYKPY